MSNPPPTIIDLKTAFLRTQILLLSQPLRAAPRPVPDDEHALRQSAVDEALHKLNALLRRHNRVSYGPQAQRHVAEQVDRLYWGEEEGGVGGVGEEWARRGADMRKDRVIEELPESWGEDAEERKPEAAARYREVRERLVELSERRRVAREKVEDYRAAKKLLEAFRGEEAGLQGNLVTKNGEVERELERMRMLMLRVERGIGGLDGEGGEEEMDIDIDEEGEEKGRKALELLG